MEELFVDLGVSMGTVVAMEGFIYFVTISRAVRTFTSGETDSE